MSQNGKGDKRRPSKPGAYARGYDAIDWSKGRKPAPPRKADVGRVLFHDYTTKPEWIIPSLEEILGPTAYTAPAPEVVRAVCGGRDGCTHPPAEEHTCPYQVDINDNHEFTCTCCADCAHECAMDI